MLNNYTDMNKMNKYLLAVALVAILIFSRVFSPYPNFTAVGAIALFAGFYFGRTNGLFLLLGSLLVSDLLFEGVYDLKMMILVYAGFAFSVWLGSKQLNFALKSKSLNSFFGITMKAILSGVIFYLISNLGVWLFSGMYAVNFSGLMECYAMAIPFFKFTWLGDLTFSALIFGTYYLVSYLKTRKQSSVLAYQRIKNQ